MPAAKRDIGWRAFQRSLSPLISMEVLSCEGAVRRFLTTWLRSLQRQRLPAFEKLGKLLLTHLTGLLVFCHEKVRFGVVEAINGNIRAVLAGAGGIGITPTYSSRSGSTRSGADASSPHDCTVVARFLGRAL